MTKKSKKSVYKISYIIILLVVSVIVFAWYSNVLTDELRGLVLDTLKEVSSQNVLVIQREIKGDLNALAEIAERIGAMEETGGKETVNTLKEIEYRYPFKRMAFCRQDGTAYTTDDRVLDVAGREYFETSIRGESYVSEPLTDSLDGEEIIIFSVPVKKENEIIGVIYAAYQVDSLKQILAVTSFEGEGYTYIIQRDGNKVVDSINPTSFQNMTNVFKSMKEADEQNTQAIEDLQVLLEHGETGYVIFYNKIAKYMYTMPLGINDWVLLEVVPVDYMEISSNYILQKTYLITIILALGCVVIAVMFFGEERKKKQQMQNLLYVDDLTGGSTLAKFKESVEQKINSGHENAAFVMMDLDDFKLINELFGYDEGDRVLCYIWDTLQKNCREEECIGRSVADRFLMLLYFDTKEEIEERIGRMAEEIQTFSISNASDYILHPVFGIYYVEKGDENEEDMRNCAALAHNYAKQEKESIYKIYTNEMKEKILQKKQLSDQIEHACENHEFVVYYQPKVDSKTKRLAGAEALVRWRRPDGKMVSPGLFIPLAEESGFVCKLDEYVFKEVCLAQKRWMDEGLDIVPISVNLSRRHLDNPEFIEEYKRILDESGVPIEYIQLEITESAMFEKKDEFVDIMEKLHRLGFMILMDDFGTGYSSLMMLKSVPIDVMKLDKSFVDDYDDVRGERIIRCVMRMAQDLSIEITAEGVETEEQYNFLRSIGCDTIQGYYFAKPMPEEEYKIRMETI